MTDDLAIIDAHHHFWDLALGKNPWLAPDQAIPFRYGDYSSIKRDFMPPDYAAVAGGHRVVASVTMEGEWDENDPVGESRWISELQTRSGTPVAHVARAFLNRDDAEAVIAGHAAFPIVRAIRHKPASAPSATAVVHGAPGSMTDPRWRRGYGLLARHGLHFELQAPWWHVDELVDLVSAFPETAVVINHTFLPADRSAEGVAGWRAALRRAAAIPQVSIKISGIGLKGRPWSLDDNRAIIRDTIEAFGADRCMFASNFPVDGLTGSFDTIYSAFKSATSDMAAPDRARLFAGNAARIYRLGAVPGVPAT